MLDLAGQIVVLTGPPGAGKTTIAAALAREPGSAKVHLQADDFWRFVANGAIPPYLDEAHAQNAVVVGALARAAEQYASGGYLVVLDGIIGPWFLQLFAGVKVPLHYLVLRPRLAAAVARCRARSGDTLSDPGRIAALHRQFAKLGELERHVLATGDDDAATTREVVRCALLGGAYRLSL